MSTDSARLYLVAYDIADDRRRNAVAKHMLSFGDRVQYSVFILTLKPARFIRMRSSLLRIADVAEDSILVCDLGPANSSASSRLSFLGVERHITPGRAIVL